MTTFEIFFHKNHQIISTNLGKKHSWVKWIQFISNEGPQPFPRAYNYEIVKLHGRNLKIFFSRTSGPIAIKFDTNYPWVKGIQVCSNEEPFNSHKVDYGFFLLLINVMIIICVYWSELFFSGERCGTWASC